MNNELDLKSLLKDSFTAENKVLVTVGFDFQVGSIMVSDQLEKLFAEGRVKIVPVFAKGTRELVEISIVGS